jgi:hypothetical protein
MFGTIRDIVALYLGSFILLISVIFIPEVKRSKVLKAFCWISIVASGALGTDALISNIRKFDTLLNNVADAKNACERSTNHLKIDSTNNAEFRKHLDSLFHSKDSSDVLPQIKNYYQKFEKGSTAIFN